MPWCEDCAKYWTPSAMNADGTCPTCGRTVESGSMAGTRNLNLRKLAAKDGEEEVRAPWHFKLLMGALALYLGWRVVQLFA